MPSRFLLIIIVLIVVILTLDLPTSLIVPTMPTCPGCNGKFKASTNHLSRCKPYRNSVDSRTASTMRLGRSPGFGQQRLNSQQSTASRSQSSLASAAPSTALSSPQQPLSSTHLHENTAHQAELPPPSPSDTDMEPPDPRKTPNVRRTCRRPPREFEDILPDGSVSRPEIDCAEQAADESGDSFWKRLFRTSLDAFSIFRKYTGVRPPDLSAPPLSLEQMSNTLSPPNRKYWPYPNLSAFLFGRWHWQQENKSLADRDRLLGDVLFHPEFRLSDLQGVNFSAIDSKLAFFQDRPPLSAALPDGWHKTDLTIDVPIPGSAPKPFVVPSLHHRKLVDVIRDVFSNSGASRTFCYTPYREYQQRPLPDGGTFEERLYGELYTSEAFNSEHEKLQREHSAGSEESYPIAIAAMMFWSDSTHVAQFGQAKLWPLYLYFGNQTKYQRCRPSCNAAQHVAYFPSIPDGIKDFITTEYEASRTPRPPVLAHCRRELMHAAWKHILDTDFIAAYQHGMVIKCADGVVRRLFPRIFTYSADYPEKVLLATVRDLGSCPCPRCLVPLANVAGLGSPSDRKIRAEGARHDDEDRRRRVKEARAHIYTGKGVVSKPVEDFLKSESLVPTTNAFSAALSSLSVDFFSFFVPDILHELDLGVWKALFTHLVRILGSITNTGIAELDQRYRRIDPFGRGIIRKFHSNVSEMRKLAARDFEDLLICSLPAFDGLFPPEYNDVVQDTLFCLCFWHALAKLRLHTETSLQLLDQVTILLGRQIRQFVVDVCQRVTAYETNKEQAARLRRVQNAKEKGKNISPISATAEKKPKEFNLFTYKFHALGDYVASIRLFGTTDSWSTQIGELEHKRGKAYWRRTNQRDAIGQITAIDRRRRFHERVYEQIISDASAKEPSTSSEASPENLPLTCPPEIHHHIGIRGTPFDLTQWLHQGMGDPALVNFEERLLDHILATLHGGHYEGRENGFSDQDRQSIAIRYNRIYRHPLLRVNYTTYDLRRDQDIINLTDKRDILLLADEDLAEGETTHPFWYARVLGIFHADVRDWRSRGNAWRRVDFLWVRWFGRDMEYDAGWRKKRLDRLGYVPATDDNAFGFVDPAWVLRGVHLIPAFSEGHTEKYLSRLSVASDNRDLGDWENYYVNRFSDRDMFMRFLGLGPGHSSLFQSNPFGIDVASCLEPLAELMELEDEVVLSGEEHLFREDDSPCDVESEEEDDKSEDEIGPESEEEYDYF